MFNTVKEPVPVLLKCTNSTLHNIFHHPDEATLLEWQKPIFKYMIVFIKNLIELCSFTGYTNNLYDYTGKSFNIILFFFSLRK